jgi:hypothetical protein
MRIRAGGKGADPGVANRAPERAVNRHAAPFIEQQVLGSNPSVGSSDLNVKRAPLAPVSSYHEPESRPSGRLSRFSGWCLTQVESEQKRVMEILTRLGIAGSPQVVLIDARADNKPSGSRA